LKYRHLFFDLDHTLWDFKTNADETLRELFKTHQLVRYGTFTVEQFISVYSDINLALWRLYQANKITQQQLRAVRFVRALTRLGVPERRGFRPTISAEFTAILPRKSAVFPYTHELLAFLKPKYRLHLIPTASRHSDHQTGLVEADFLFRGSHYV
jgi:putative hydrolase of the HAD superfamily